VGRNGLVLVSDVGASKTVPAEAWRRRGGAGKDRVGRSFTGRVGDAGSLCEGFR
jgi:hypothetical protein